MSDFVEGYKDGRDPDCPEPNDNRSEKYKHSFKVGRAELNGAPIPAPTSRKNAEIAQEKDEAR